MNKPKSIAVVENNDILDILKDISYSKLLLSVGVRLSRHMLGRWSNSLLKLTYQPYLLMPPKRLPKVCF